MDLMYLSYGISSICLFILILVLYKLKVHRDKVYNNPKIEFRIFSTRYVITPEIFKTQAVAWIIFLIIPYINLLAFGLLVFINCIYIIFVIIPRWVGDICLKIIGK